MWRHYEMKSDILSSAFIMRAWRCGIVICAMSRVFVNIGSVYGLSPYDTKPLPEPIL